MVSKYINWWFELRLMKDSRFKKRPKGSWERKAETALIEIKKKLKKSSFSLTLPIALFIIIFLTIYFYFVFSDLPNDRRLWTFISLFPSLRPNDIILLIFVPSLVSGAAYIFQIVNGRSYAKSPKFKICNKCYNEDLIGRKECGCGGEFEPPDFYNFIEEKEKNQEQI